MHDLIVITVWISAQDSWAQVVVTGLTQERSEGTAALVLNNAYFWTWSAVFMQDLDSEDNEDIDAEGDGHDEL